MLERLSIEMSAFKLNLAHNLPLMLQILSFLWLINIINWLLKSRLNIFGLIPRRTVGIPGILFSFLLHANFNHLFFNSLPFFVLGLFLLNQGINIFITYSIIIIISEGILTWLFARRGNHIGASGLISGYFSVVLFSAYNSPNLTTIVLAIIAIYYFGTILLNLFPNKIHVSWESHLFGFISGIIASFCINYT